jgi:hypothetical protein
VGALLGITRSAATRTAARVPAAPTRARLDTSLASASPELDGLKCSLGTVWLGSYPRTGSGG